MNAWMLAAVMAVPGAALAATTSGKLTKVQGEVFIKIQGADEGKGTAGAVLAAGTQVRTGPAGNAEVTFDDGSLLRVQPGTSFVLSPSKRQGSKKSSVLLFFGRVWSKVTSHAGETSYEVSTPNAVCGVRGTEFTTSVADDGSVRMEVSEGKVEVESDGQSEVAGAGQQVEADERGVEDTEAAAGEGAEKAWRAEKRERLRTQGEGIVQSLKSKVMAKKERLEKLRAQQQEIEGKRKRAEERARAGDEDALNEIRGYNKELARIADEIADLGDEAQAQLGLVDHFADLAGDPRFKMVNRKTMEAEAASLRRVKATLDKLVADGTDLSIEGMDKMLDDMSKGKGSLKEKKGSSTQDLFGDDTMR
jgi:hypothetical protein